MNFYLPIYRDLPIAKKITVLLIVVGTLGFVQQAFHTYYLVSKNVELMLGKRLEHIARSGAMMIPGELHQQVLDGYLEEDPEITQREPFQKIQAVLRNVKIQNDLKTDIYTVIRPEWQPDTMIFVTMSNEKTYVGNGLPLHPMALTTLETGEATHTGLYEDKEGVWVSAWAPVKTADGITVAALEVDYRASEELAEAKSGLARDLGLTMVGALLMLCLLGTVSGRALARPIRALTKVAGEVSKGNLDVTSESRSRDELGLLATTFNVMVDELRKNRRALEDYAKNLEQKVDERTRELRSANETISAMINSLSQGFLIFNREGICSDVYSVACEDLLQTTPAGKPVWEVLKLERKDLEGQIGFLFDEPIPFDDTAALCPRTYAHSEGKYVALGYYPVRAENGKVDGIVLVATDKTEEIEATRAAEHERTYAKAVVKLVKHRSQFLDFLREGESILQALREELSRADNRPLDVDKAFRLMHTIKGGAAIFSVGELASLAHDYESRLSELRIGSVPVPRQALPEFTNGVEKLSVALKSFVEEHREIIGNALETRERQIEIPFPKLVEFANRLKAVPGGDGIREDFLESFIREPIQNSFSHLESAATQLASTHEKMLKPIVFRGGDLRILSEPYRELFSTLIHAVRNSVDHGIESPPERVSLGKPEAGEILIEFAIVSPGQSSPWLKITFSDDGRGVDPELIRRKLRGIGEAEAAKKSDHEVIQHVFDSGLTTKQYISEISGRGVGADAILQAARKLGGTARVFSVVGKGTKVVIIVPYFEKLEKLTLKNAA